MRTLFCSYTGCSAEISQRSRTGLCRYHRVRVNGEKLQARLDAAGVMCSEGCGRGAAWNHAGMCAACHVRAHRGGYKGPAVQERSNEPVSYKQTHIRLSRHLGKAANKLCVDCGEQAGHWSYDGNCPEEQVEDGLRWCRHDEHYKPRCVPDHSKYDSAFALSGGSRD